MFPLQRYRDLYCPPCPAGHGRRESYRFCRSKGREQVGYSVQNLRTKPGRHIIPYGGSSLQGGDGTWDLADRAFQVSYNRPFYTRAFDTSAWFFGAEYAMVRWLEANGYDVSYSAGIDAASKRRSDPEPQNLALCRTRRVRFRPATQRIWRRLATQASVWPSSAEGNPSGKRNGTTASMAQALPFAH